MDKLLSSLFLGDARSALQIILDVYDRNHFCVVDYVYFANIYGKKMFDHHSASYDTHLFTSLLLAGYKQTDIQQVYTAYQDAIQDADILLPDGIALQIFYYLAKKRWLHNLNGTDFAPYVLESLVQKFGSKKVRILLYGTYPHLLQKTKTFLQDKWYQVVYAQDGYTNLDWDQLDAVLPSQEWVINVLLVARSTPLYPIQEIWTYANKDNLKKYKLLVMNQAGTFDWRVGEQKRAPELVRSLRLERLWRFLADPKRNYKKILDSLGIIVYVFSYLLLKKKSR